MVNLHFSKMHGIGNDYVYVNCLEKTLSHPENVVQWISDRHFGVGADGLVLILPSNKADFKMRMYNADGSEGSMCGNAIRCVGKYLYDHRLTDKTDLTISTRSGIKHLTLIPENERAVWVEVDMGKALLDAKDIPVETEFDEFICQPMIIEDEPYLVTCVSMGNPHAIIFCEDVDEIPLERIGPKFEHNEIFPDRINTEFAQIIDRQTIKMRVWERGSGETYACGTGACACVVAAALSGYCDQDTEITVRLKGGDLYVTYRADGTVLMKGTATHVFDGELELPETFL